MDNSVNNPMPGWLIRWMKQHRVEVWGIAGLEDLDTPEDPAGKGFPRALSFALPMAPEIMAGIRQGPTDAYAEAYRKANRSIDQIAAELSELFHLQGYRALVLPASHRTDAVNLRGDFPHKTAATRAGIGWIGRHCQLITRPYGPLVRLGTVFTDADLPVAVPVEKGHCGKCTRCIDACPAGALKMSEWVPGLPRAKMLDAHACDRYKVKKFYKYNHGDNCGICVAVCPYGLKMQKKTISRSCS